MRIIAASRDLHLHLPAHTLPHSRTHTYIFLHLAASPCQDFAKRESGSNDWAMQEDGRRHPEARAVRGAALDFATLVRRQLVGHVAPGLTLCSRSCVTRRTSRPCTGT